MDKALREEFRAFRVEIEDRVRRLEEALQSLSDVAATVADKTSDAVVTAKLEAKKANG